MAKAALAGFDLEIGPVVIRVVPKDGIVRDWELVGARYRLYEQAVYRLLQNELPEEW